MYSLSEDLQTILLTAQFPAYELVQKFTEYPPCIPRNSQANALVNQGTTVFKFSSAAILC